MENKSEVLDNMELLGNLLFTYNEAYEILELEADLFPLLELQKAHTKGKNTREIKIRASLLQLADNGSHPALEKAFLLLNKLNASDV